jgi:hypothetical protein
VYVQANFLEREVQDRFFAALNDEAMMLAWRDAEADDVDRAKVLDDIDADEAQLDVLADALGNREMTPARYKDQVAKVNARLAANRRLLRTAEGPAAMVAVEGGVDRLMERWSSMPMGQRRAKLMCAMDHFTVKRTAVKGSKKFDPERVAVQWFDAAP